MAVAPPSTYTCPTGARRSTAAAIRVSWPANCCATRRSLTRGRPTVKMTRALVRRAFCTISTNRSLLDGANSIPRADSIGRQNTGTLWSRDLVTKPRQASLILPQTNSSPPAADAAGGGTEGRSEKPRLSSSSAAKNSAPPAASIESFHRPAHCRSSAGVSHSPTTIPRAGSGSRSPQSQTGCEPVTPSKVRTRGLRRGCSGSSRKSVLWIGFPPMK